MLTPEERSLRSKLAAHRMHAMHDSHAVTAKARQAALDRFEREVDPDGTLPDAERQRRAEHVRKAYFTELAFKSAVARRKAREAAAAADELRAALSEEDGWTDPDELLARLDEL